jgi:CBS domain-containing protein
MTCSEALIPNYISLKAHQTVDESLAILHQYNIRSVPVVDETGNYLGMFNLRIILHSLIPIAIRMEGGIENAEFMGQATPEMARQLKVIGPHRIDQHLDMSKQSVHPETSLIEVIRLMAKQGSPLPVTNKENNQLIGIISEQSILSKLGHLQAALSSKADELSSDDIVLLKRFKVIH